MIESANERVLLLKSGFTGKQIEALYCVLNRFEEVGVDWHEAAAKLAGAFSIPTNAYLATCSVKAAEAGRDEAAVKPARFFESVSQTLQAGTQAAPPQGVRA